MKFKKFTKTYLQATGSLENVWQYFFAHKDS